MNARARLEKSSVFMNGCWKHCYLSYFGDMNMHFFLQVRLVGRKFKKAQLAGMSATTDDLPPMTM